jgi:hypothetical protein
MAKEMKIKFAFLQQLLFSSVLAAALIAFSAPLLIHSMYL